VQLWLISLNIDWIHRCISCKNHDASSVRLGRKPPDSQSNSLAKSVKTVSATRNLCLQLNWYLSGKGFRHSAYELYRWGWATEQNRDDWHRHPLWYSTAQGPGFIFSLFHSQFIQLSHRFLIRITVLKSSQQTMLVLSAKVFWRSAYISDRCMQKIKMTVKMCV
jgi:hypothetical protein